MKANKILAAISAIAISVGAGQASAQEVQAGIFKIATGASEKIDRFGVCRVIKNVGTHPIMVPTNTAQEWSVGASSFLQNITKMSGISATECVVVTDVTLFAATQVGSFADLTVVPMNYPVSTHGYY